VGTAILNTLTATYKGSATTPSPSFSSSVYSYTYTVANAGGNNIFILTPTLPGTDTTSTITIGGAIVASGTAYTIPSLSVGYNYITVTVINSTGTKLSYELTINRTS
jgi:hypothetical protein